MFSYSKILGTLNWHFHAYYILFVHFIVLWVGNLRLFPTDEFMPDTRLIEWSAAIRVGLPHIGSEHRLIAS